MTTASYVGIDIETTGLDTSACELLEIAVVVFDSAMDIIDYMSVPVTNPEMIDDPKDPVSTLKSLCAANVVDMHEGTGLWADLAQLYNDPAAVAAHAPSRVAEDILALLDKHEARGVPVLGSSQSFDRAVLQRIMPDVNRSLHYRNVDASTLIELVVRSGHIGRDLFAPAVTAQLDEEMTRLGLTGRTHRALYDVLRSRTSITVCTQLLSTTPLDFAPWKKAVDRAV